jgi:hypothetical protein
MGTFDGWVRDFEAAAQARQRTGEPDWRRGAGLDPTVVRSVQRFQVGESGDGANLVAKAGGGAYGTAVRLFVTEEQNHARLLAKLLAAAGAPTIASHWSDAVFVRLRRALGLRLELLVLLVAEVIALTYYRALRDGTGDPLTTDVAGRILADEERHVPFHRDRLGRIGLGWRILLAGTAVVVAIDHGPALRRLGMTRRRFVVETVARPFRASGASFRGWADASASGSSATS